MKGWRKGTIIGGHPCYSVVERLLQMHRLSKIFRVGTVLLAGIFLFSQVMPHLARAEEKDPAGIDDQQIAAFFESVEESFRKKRVPDVMAKLHKKFSYIMTYCTDESFSVVENDIKTYRVSVGSFFMSDPDVLEFAVHVDQVERLGEKIAVVARIKSVVLLHNIVNTCETSSNYTLLPYQGSFLIRDIRGDASCTNREVTEEAQN